MTKKWQRRCKNPRGCC